MLGYGATSYGDGFADVYDDWYGAISDVEATVDRVVGLVGPGARVLELGVGTGRLAVPLVEAGMDVVGVDASRAMLDRIDPDAFASGRLHVVEGDMVDAMPAGPFDAALVAYNTILNLLSAARQQACFEAVAGRLRRNGAFVVEAAVPDRSSAGGRRVAVRSIETDRVVLSLTEHRPESARSNGHFVELGDRGTGTGTAGLRLRPWAVRWTDPAELDQMARQAGFTVERRDADMSGTPFTADDAQHVTVYRRNAAP